jgi:hypothetical protein
MPIESVHQVNTERKDEIHLTLVSAEGRRTILMTVVDADESRVPTVELTIDQLEEIHEWLIDSIADLQEAA